jgi:hypothetical protein
VHRAIVTVAVIVGCVVREAASQSLIPLAEAAAAEIASSARGGAGPGGALVWSVLGTALPLAAGAAIAAGTNPDADNATARTALAAGLMWGGVFAGPALGYFRGGRSGRGWKGVVTRAGFFALAWSFSPSMGSDEGLVPDPAVENMAVWVVARAFIAASAFNDIATVHRAVRRANRVSIGVVAPTGGAAPGLGVRIAF